jgi:hypothetical protein
VEFPCSQIRRLDIVMSFLHNFVYRFDEIPVKIPRSNFIDINKLIPNFIIKNQKAKKANIIFKEKNQFGEQTLQDIVTYYKATMIKAVW